MNNQPVNTRHKLFRDARRDARDEILRVMTNHNEANPKKDDESFEALAMEYEMVRLAQFCGIRSLEGNVEDTFQRIVRDARQRKTDPGTDAPNQVED